MKRNDNIGFRIFNLNRTRPGSYSIRSVMQQSYIQEDYVCQHSDFNNAVHSSKRSKNKVCKAKLSVRIKPITANTSVKDKYVKVCMINTCFSWLGALIIGLTETISAR